MGCLRGLPRGRPHVLLPVHQCFISPVFCISFSLSFTFASVPARVVLNNRYPARGVPAGYTAGLPPLYVCSHIANMLPAGWGAPSDASGNIIVERAARDFLLNMDIGQPGGVQRHRHPCFFGTMEEVIQTQSLCSLIFEDVRFVA